MCELNLSELNICLFITRSWVYNERLQSGCLRAVHHTGSAERDVTGSTLHGQRQHPLLLLPGQEGTGHK